MFTRDSAIISHNIKTPLTSISRAVGNILQLTDGQLIKSLFSNNEQGFAYDPNDLSTMFQDSAGTVPVTGVGQPVGLMLDKSKGLARGATNFWTGSVTKIDANWANNGDGTFTSNGGSGGVGLTSTSMQAGRFYEWTFEVTSRTSGAVRPQNGSGLNYQYASSAGTHIQKALCVDNSLYFYSNAFNGTIRPISVRELAGNHAYQTVSASRPVLTNRVNLFNDSELFSTWTRNDGIALATPNPKYPNAVKLTRGASSVYIHRAAMTTIGTYTLTGLFKNVVGTVNAILANTTAVPMTKVGVTADGLDIYQSTQTIASVPNSSVTGIVLYNANDSVEVYGLDVRVTQQNSTLPPYQKVVGSTQFDTVGFPNYLLFDGADDFLQTNNIDFTATDKVSLFAGVRKLSDVNTGIVAELSTRAGITTNLGAFVMYAPFDAVQTGYGFRSVGTLEATTFNTLPLSPTSNVLAAKSSIAQDTLTLRVDSLQYGVLTQDQGTGNFGNYPLYIGRRGGTILPFNGHIYSLIGIGRLTTDSETVAIEKELAKRLGVTLNV